MSRILIAVLLLAAAVAAQVVTPPPTNTVRIFTLKDKSPVTPAKEVYSYLIRAHIDGLEAYTIVLRHKRADGVVGVTEIPMRRASDQYWATTVAALWGPDKVVPISTEIRIAGVNMQTVDLEVQ